MSKDTEQLEGFLALSAALTGFATVELRGTGQCEAYFATLCDMAGKDTVRVLLESFASVNESVAGNIEALDRELRITILGDVRLGPIARNIIKLWYVGIWYQVPREWREAFGGAAIGQNFMVSPTAYTEGLLWPAIGANPQGAKPHGYGMWAFPPRIAPLPRSKA